MKKYMGLKEALARVEAHGDTKEDLLKALRRGEIHALAESHRLRNFHGTITDDSVSPGAYIGDEAWNGKIDWQNDSAHSVKGKGWDEVTEEVIGIYLFTAEVDEIWPQIEASKLAPNLPTYVSPYIYLMLEAIQHFEISPERPPVHKKLIAHWFMERGLPDGTAIEKTLADYMATCCRPVEHQKHGAR